MNASPGKGRRESPGWHLGFKPRSRIRGEPGQILVGGRVSRNRKVLGKVTNPKITPRGA